MPTCVSLAFPFAATAAPAGSAALAKTASLRREASFVLVPVPLDLELDVVENCRLREELVCADLVVVDKLLEPADLVEAFVEIG